jgi:hypothetical protein
LTLLYVIEKSVLKSKVGLQTTFRVRERRFKATISQSASNPDSAHAPSVFNKEKPASFSGGL